MRSEVCSIQKRFGAHARLTETSFVLVVPSHITYDGFKCPCKPWPGISFYLWQKLILDQCAGFASGAWCLTDSPCVRKRLIDSMTMSPPESGSPCSVNHWSCANMKSWDCEQNCVIVNQNINASVCCTQKYTFLTKYVPVACFGGTDLSFYLISVWFFFFYILAFERII